MLSIAANSHGNLQDRQKSANAGNSFEHQHAVVVATAKDEEDS